MLSSSDSAAQHRQYERRLAEINRTADDRIIQLQAALDALQDGSLTCYSEQAGVSDEWCDENCNAPQPFCPEETCTCSANGDSRWQCADGSLPCTDGHALGYLTDKMCEQLCVENVPPPALGSCLQAPFGRKADATAGTYTELNPDGKSDIACLHACNGAEAEACIWDCQGCWKTTKANVFEPWEGIVPDCFGYAAILRPPPTARTPWLGVWTPVADKPDNFGLSKLVLAEPHYPLPEWAIEPFIYPTWIPGGAEDVGGDSPGHELQCLDNDDNETDCTPSRCAAACAGKIPLGPNIAVDARVCTLSCGKCEGWGAGANLVARADAHKSVPSFGTPMTMVMGNYWKDCGDGGCSRGATFGP